MSLVEIKRHACIGCGVCVDSCPMDVLRMDVSINKAIVAYGEDCQACFLCVFDCPRQAITVRGAEYDQSHLALRVGA